MQIRHRVTGAILWEDSAKTLRGANLEGAILQDAILRGADLRGANLEGAILQYADLRGADLEGADLRGADLRGANLGGADLRGANLRGANLRDANLEDADLRGANLRGAILRGAPCVNAEVYGSLYEYVGAAFIAADGAPWVRMGCLWKAVADWDAIGIEASNPREFPADGSAKSAIRAAAFRFLRERALWLADHHAGPATSAGGN